MAERYLAQATSMTDLLRKSGIEIVGDVPWGTHLCQLYKTRDDLLDLLVPYFKAGLESNELCIWVASDPLGVRDAENALREAVFDYDTLKSRGRIEIAPHATWCMKDGCLDPRAVLEGLAGRLEGALERGLEGIRAAGITAGLEGASLAGFNEHEELFGEMIGGCRMLAVCTYPLDRCSASDVIELLNNHLYALARNEGEWQLIRVDGEPDGYVRAVSTTCVARSVRRPSRTRSCATLWATRTSTIFAKRSRTQPGSSRGTSASAVTSLTASLPSPGPGRSRPGYRK